MKHFTNYTEVLDFMKERWARKPALRALYHRWFGRIVAELSPQRPVVEIGSGCGNFKRFFPATVATDAIVCGNWIEKVVDARQMPFAPGEVGNFVLVDCLHHLPRPLRFLRAAERALKPGGRIVLFEPAATPWARLVWKLFHFEPVDLRQDVFAEDDTPEPANEGFMFANMGIAAVLFGRGLPETLKRVPGLKLTKLEYSDFFIYPATGGYSSVCLVPGPLLGPLHSVERVLTRPFGSWLTGMRILIVLEKTGAPEPEAARPPAAKSSSVSASSP
ncbi:MAG: methyltransferase domain-containing protein [Planctomycetes bacterium]|nr:methyltransferase domain-containing protein [Planctomycetota bacterium]